MVHKNFLQNTQKAQAQKVINYTFSKLKTFALQETLKENKKTSHGLGKKYFKICTSHHIAYKIYKEHFQINNKNPKYSIFKNG